MTATACLSRDCDTRLRHCNWKANGYFLSISSGRINSRKSMDTACPVVEAFDSRLSDLRSAAHRPADRMYVISQSELDKRKRETPEPKR